MLVKHARILLVEDDEDDYILICESLAQLDSYRFDVEWVTNSKQALDKLLHGDFDICLLDYQLGGQSGLDVLRQAERAGCPTPVIMLTGQTDDSLDKFALDAGAVDYLNKEEISTARFARAVRYALARNEASIERLERLKAETQNRSKDRFLAHLSHELRTPLTSILGYTELLLNSDKVQQATAELNIIMSNGKHLLSLLNDVLDLSKIAADKLELNPSQIQLSSFVSDVFYLLQINARDKGLRLEIESKSELPVTIFADATRLRQILINLTYNAIKFTEHGQVTINLSTQGSGQNEQLWFQVLDTGMGIPPARLSSIFEPFEQIEDIVTRKESGAGLGLAICTELVKRMGGELAVESQIGVGSCFRFAINTGDISNVSRQMLIFDKTANSAKNEFLPSLSGRILVVDDANDIRLLIKTICQNFGLHVDTARNGLQAVEICQQSLAWQQPYDVVLMDIHMPVMDGRQAITKIRQLGFKSPVIAITAAVLKGVKDSLIAIGFTDVLHKPLNKHAMYLSLSHYLTDQSTQLLQPTAACANDNKTPSTCDILLVEDDPDAADITQLLLQSLGANVVIAHNGEECLTLLKSQTAYSKILLDLHLPDIDGITLATQIRQLCPLAEIIIVSGTEVDQSKLDAVGIKQALLKPLNLAKLQSLLLS
ncbi:response regulator [Paraglaciecola sp.]|uniref:response regulator n=1 Tax=Paraglaciecola sp. TaxID=1920173 RepID=UPI0030F48A20